MCQNIHHRYTVAHHKTRHEKPAARTRKTSHTWCRWLSWQRAAQLARWRYSSARDRNAARDDSVANQKYGQTVQRLASIHDSLKLTGTVADNNSNTIIISHGTVLFVNGVCNSNSGPLQSHAVNNVNTCQDWTRLTTPAMW